MFILMYVLSYVGGANLLRHAEGATWLAIVTVSKQSENNLGNELKYRFPIILAKRSELSV